MGIINVTPDSFSGDGTGGDLAAAVALATAFEAAGADILDLGGESTRPGAEPLTAGEEWERVGPAIEAVRAVTSLPISIDTMHASIADAAFQSGADMLNDVSGLRGDPDLARVAAAYRAPVVVMHNQRGRPFTDVIADIRDGLETSMDIALRAGIPGEALILDPGFGFGWSPEQNLEMLRRLPELWELERPLLVGPSRKSTLGFVTGAAVEARFAASAAAVAISVAAGADIVRVHDVAQMRQVVQVADAITRATWKAT